MENSKIERLIQSMTIEEKLAQMTQLSAMFLGTEQNMDLTGPLAELNITEENMTNIGSTLNYFGAEKTMALQKRYMEKNRHHIPLLFMADVIYGYKTIFPIPLAMSCSFNPENYENAASVAAAESSASGIHLTFAPMSDLVRDPRWGRVMESPGEDPYLNCIMTKAAVHGFQGDNPKEKGKIASCVKHFAGYGAAEGGRDYNWVDISENTFRQFYLPSYKAALDAGARMVMTSFNVMDGIPSSANKKLFRDILRNEWGFDGCTISDYAAVHETIINGVAEDGSDAARQCIEAGIDIEMMSAHYINHGKKLVEQGRLSMELIDQAVRNILNLKNELGLFENPFKDANPEAEKKLHLCKEHREKARQAARQSIVLLKNDGILPLKEGIKIGIAGPFAESKNTAGGWAITAEKNTCSLADALKSHGFSVITAMTEPLGSMEDQMFDIKDQTEQAVERFSDCDILIAAVGESPFDTGEASSKAYLRLSPNQEKLIQKLSGTGKPVITIVFSGRPMEIKPILSTSNALVQGWFLGTESANGLSDVLTGEYNPSGRLAMSFPHTIGQIPVYYNNYRTGRPYYGQKERYVSKYLDCPNEALFPFGYGLSYSRINYSDFSVTKKQDRIQAEITVYNDSEREALETVQLYVCDCVASIVRPVKELKGFQQVMLQPKQKQKVSFTITKDMLRFYNRNMEFIFEPGEFEIMIGRNSQDVESKRIYLD
nr:beta-glucosidase BglX [uncultured Blautia sp.]